MPDILIRLANIAALATLVPFDKDAPVGQWKFRRCPYRKGLYTLLARTDAAAGNMRMIAEIGTTQVVQESPISAGGTDGVFPTPAGANATPAHQFFADYNDEIILTVKEVGNVAAKNVAIWANVEPAA